MKTIHQWLEEYQESHQNPVNKAIHWICVPLIMFRVIGALWVIPVPEFFRQVPLLNWGTVALLLGLLFYLRLSFTMFLGFIAVSVAIAAGNVVLNSFGNQVHLLVCAAIFAVSWIGQFIGHGREGKKPSFFKDLQFLMIGPAWLMHFIFKKIGISY